MEQSPKARRPHAPGEKPSEDSLPYHETGGEKIPQQGPKGDGMPKSPQPIHAGSYQGGNRMEYSSRGTSKPADLSHGTPGYVSSEDSKRKGGEVHRFPNGSE